jgi:hypothetical protein
MHGALSQVAVGIALDDRRVQTGEELEDFVGRGAALTQVTGDDNPIEWTASCNIGEDSPERQAESVDIRHHRNPHGNSFPRPHRRMRLSTTNGG